MSVSIDSLDQEKEDAYTSTISAITYRDGKILKQETVSEPLGLRLPQRRAGLELGRLRAISKQLVGYTIANQIQQQALEKRVTRAEVFDKA